MTRAACAKVINTVAVPIFADLWINPVGATASGGGGESGGESGGEYLRFRELVLNGGWYEQVGAVIAASMLVNAFMCLVPFAAKWKSAALRRLHGHRARLIQADLNQLHEGGEYVM